MMLNKKKISLVLAFCLSLSIFAAGCNKEDDSVETSLSANVITQDNPNNSADVPANTTPAETVTEIISVTDDSGNAVTGADGEAVTEVAVVTNAPAGNDIPAEGTISPAELEAIFNEATAPVTAVVPTSQVAKTDKYAYNTLTDDEKGLYDYILQCAENMKFKVNITDKVTPEIWAKILGMVYNQEPQLFWLHSKSKPGRLYFHEYDADVVASMQKDIDATVNKLLKDAEAKTSTYDKLKVFHDYLVLNSTFELGESGEGNYNSTIYSAFGKANGTQGNVQCAGYAKSMKYLCDRAGINSMVITGNNKKGDTHAWVIVDVGGEWYNLDVTWDDPILNPADPTYIRNVYFLVPDKWVTDNTHFNANVVNYSGGSFKYFTPPACTATSQNYFVKNNMVYSDADSATAAIKAQIDNVVPNKGRVIEILCESKSVYDAVYGELKSYQAYAREKSSDVKGLSDNCNDVMLLIELDVQYN